MSDHVRLTEELIRAGMTGGIGINKRQKKILGLPYLTRGWLERLVGTEIPRSDYDEFVALKGKTQTADSHSGPRPDAELVAIRVCSGQLTVLSREQRDRVLTYL